MPERGKCQREGCRGGAARAPWFSCPDPEGDCGVLDRGDGPEPLTFPPEWNLAPTPATEGAR